MRLRKRTVAGEHNLTVPDHKVAAEGMLNDILTSVSLWNNIPEKDWFTVYRSSNCG